MTKPSIGGCKKGAKKSCAAYLAAGTRERNKERKRIRHEKRMLRQEEKVRIRAERLKAVEVEK